MSAIRKKIKRILTLALTASLCSVMTITAFADEPYNSYSYDSWEEPIPSQSAYRISKTITGYEIGLEQLRDQGSAYYVADDAVVTLSGARDLFCDEDAREFWIADTGNHRIIRTDEDFYLKGVYYGVSGDSEINKDEATGLSNFNEPMGIYVKTSMYTNEKMVYIADNKNSRVVKAKLTTANTLELVQEYTKPEDALYTQSTFNPSKVIADNAENVYAVVTSVNTGAVQFARDGKFTGFYGANRVEVTAKVIAQTLWRKIASNDQINAMERNVPAEYNNFDIDSDGFIYTVTEKGNTSTDAVKKLNSAGYNIWNNNAGNEYKFGDITDAVWDSVSNKKHNKMLTDIVVDKFGRMNVLDFETGRVFQYDKNANLICIFGTKTSSADQRGSFSQPNAVETLGENVYVIDGSKNDITVFTTTTFGQQVHKAVNLYDEGKYTEAVPYWNNVMDRDGLYTLAYIGMGKASLNQEKYTEALDYFKTAYDRDDYDKAFKYAREDFLREHFTAVIIIILVIIALFIVRKVLISKGIIVIHERERI